MSRSVIKAENLSKMYQLGDIGTGTISRDLERYWTRLRGKEDPFFKIGEVDSRLGIGGNDAVWSLKNINFEIQRGDAIGVIGSNGAGKSTLLKILSRITSPTKGTVKIKGRVASLLEVGTGFHGELSGRENIYLNGAILGMRKTEIARKLTEIVEFSGIERYIDTPVKRYSSGMYVRLAFAVAAHLESEILIVDEVLAVGDAEFQKKCLGKMNSISKGEGRTILFVSHNLPTIMKLCDKGMVLVDGQVMAYESISRAVQYYTNNKEKESIFEKIVNRYVYFNDVKLCDLENISRTDFLHTESLKIIFKLEVLHLDLPYKIFATVLDRHKNKVFSTEVSVLEHKNIYELIINSNFLVRGSYSLHCFIHSPGVKLLSVVEDDFNFNIVDDNSGFALYGPYDYGNVFGNCYWL